MSEQYEKYLRKLSKELRIKLDNAIQKIIRWDFTGLDIKELKGNKRIYRARVGKFRILFRKNRNSGEIIEINTRGDIY